MEQQQPVQLQVKRAPVRLSEARVEVLENSREACRQAMA